MHAAMPWGSVVLTRSHAMWLSAFESWDITVSCFPFESKAIFFWFRVIAPDYSCLVPVEQIVKPGFFALNC